MSNDETDIVHIVQNQNNSKELYEQWNNRKETDIKCSKIGCSNDSNNNAYLVTRLSPHDEKFIIPLCTKCYELGINSKSNSSSQTYLIKVAANSLVKDISKWRSN